MVLNGYIYVRDLPTGWALASAQNMNFGALNSDFDYFFRDILSMHTVHQLSLEALFPTFVEPFDSTMSVSISVVYIS
jgi:hypothetical protein